MSGREDRSSDQLDSAVFSPMSISAWLNRRLNMATSAIQGET
jgi:hypothetical protein